MSFPIEHFTTEHKPNPQRFNAVSAQSLRDISISLITGRMRSEGVLIDGITREELAGLSTDRRSGVYAVMAASLYARVVNLEKPMHGYDIRRTVDMLQGLMGGLEIDSSAMFDFISNNGLWNHKITLNMFGYLTDPASLQALHRFPYR